MLEAFEHDGCAGLEDQRTRPLQHPENQLSRPLLNEVLDLQPASPRAGRFRIHGILGPRREEPPPRERTVGRAMAINRPLHGAPGPWQSAREAPADVPSCQHLPYRPAYRPHLWFTEMRYRVQLEGRWVDSLGRIAGDARKMVAGMASPPQDLTAILPILCAALAA